MLKNNQNNQNNQNIKNNKISLILSGGSALGFAHIGVFKYLEEENIKLEQIIGTSMGALIGAFYAIGFDYKKIYDFLENLTKFDLLKLSFSFTSFNKNIIYNFLKKTFQNKTFLDTIFDLKIIATNLEDGVSCVFDKKNNVLLVDAIMASISIPGLFFPKKINDKNYIDGFVSSNLPFEFANKKNKILAINVDNLKNLKDINFPKRFLFHKLKRKIYLLTNAYYLMINNQIKIKLEHFENKKNLFLLDIDVSKFRKSDFKNWKKISNKGYMEIKNYFLK